MNKRGDLPTILLFVAALVLYSAALFSFISFNDNFAENSEERGEIISNINFYESYIFAQIKLIAEEIISEGGLIRENIGLKDRFKEIASERNLEIQDMENYYGKIIRGEFDFARDANKYWFEIRDLKLRAERGASFIERTVSYKIDFDYSGDVLTGATKSVEGEIIRGSLGIGESAVFFLIAKSI